MLVIIDEATRYMAATILDNERTETIIKAVEEIWIRWAGKPELLRLDELRGHCSKEFLAWSERHGVKLEMIGGEQCWHLGVVGRHQQVFREMLTKYARETGDDPTTCVTWCVAAKNALPRVKGYSPDQWVLATARDIPESLTSDNFNLAVHSQAVDDDNYGKNLERRATAEQIAIEADEAQHVRRALLNQSRPQLRLFTVGECVYYWRVQGSHRLAGSYHGPAMVVALEQRPGSIRPRVVWIVHGPRILRCAHEHLRPEFSNERYLRPLNVDDA